MRSKVSKASQASKASKASKSADAPNASTPRQPSKSSNPSKRKSPAFDATDFAGRRKKGGDENWYKSVEKKTGGYRWAIVKAAVKPVKRVPLDLISPSLKNAEAPKVSRRASADSNSDDSDSDSEESESEVQVKRIKLSTLAGKVSRS